MGINLASGSLAVAGIKATTRHLLTVLAIHADDDTGHCFPSVSVLVDETGMNRKTIQSGLRELKDAGILTDTGERIGRTRQVIVYRVDTTIKQALKRNSTEIGPGPFSTGKRPKNGRKEAQNRATEKTWKKQEKYNPPCIPPTGDDRHDDDSAPASDQHAQNPAPDPTGDARAGDGDPGGGGGGQPAADRDQRESHPRPAAKRKSQFPADWWPSEAGMLYAIERGCPDIAANVAACVDHHRARGNVFLDHAAAWRTWCNGARDRFGWAGGGAAVDPHRGRGAARDQRPSARNSAYHRMLAATAQSGSSWPETGDGGADW